MQTLNEKTINTAYGEKSIAVVCDDICNIDEQIDVMTLSAFQGSYIPTPNTLFEALYNIGIDVNELSKNPLIDIRELCNIWLSNVIKKPAIPINQIGCIEMSKYSDDRTTWMNNEKKMLDSISAYFKMLDIFSLSDTQFSTLGLPILGGGSQRIPTELIVIPMINECINFLKNNLKLKRIVILTNNMNQAYTAAKALDESYAIFKNYSVTGNEPVSENDNLAFISYSSKNKNIADNLCSKIEAEGVKVWYAPRNIIAGDYASAIVDAISICTHFIVILSKDSFNSKHVLNEIDLAFNERRNNIKFYLLKIDEEEMGPAFRYYLSRQHWMDANCPPLEKRLDEFVNKIITEL